MKKHLILILVVLMFFYPLSFLIPKQAEAISLPFGGIIIFPVPCICSYSLLIHIIPIGASSPPAVNFIPGVSQLYSFFNLFRPGAYLLGTYGPPSPCFILVPFPPFCIPYPLAPAAPTIILVGTSI